jgi:hypothetical protein
MICAVGAHYSVDSQLPSMRNANGPEIPFRERALMVAAVP